MISKCLIVVAFAILGVSGQSIFNSNGQSSGCNAGKENFGTSIPVTHIRTSIFESPTVEIPSYSFPTTVSEACHCMKTIVKPQLRKEIISVPTVDRIVQTVCTPHFETIDCGERSVQNSKIGSGERSGNNNVIGNSGFQGSNSNNFNSGSLMGGNFGNAGTLGGNMGSSFGGQTGSVNTGSVFGGSQGSLFSCNTGAQSQNQKSSSSISGLFGGNSGSVLGATSGSLMGGNSGSHAGGQTSEISSFAGGNKQESESLTSLFDNYFKNQNICHHNF